MAIGSPVKVTKGSIQYWPVKVTDHLDTIDNLEGKDLRYDLYKYIDDESEELIDENMSAEADGMYALPLIDSNPLEPGLYNVYITFIASPQTPRLGPHRFLLEASTLVP